MPLIPKPAATVVLLRDGRDGPETLLVQRSPALVFGGGAYVFPGGRVDAADHTPFPGCTIDDATASRQLGMADGGLAYLQAAIRECFEEAGILLAEYPNGKTLSDADLADLRDALRNGTTDLGTLLDRQGLVPSIDRLRYLARWITPPGRPRRFDTRFFLAPAPTAQNVTVCGEETVGARWVTPKRALEDGAQGRIWLMGPTRYTLNALTGHRTLAALFRHLDEREVDFEVH
ncbi:MAG: hypothetical protein WED00_00435 [Aquisalimonadaceae bacterium]